MTPSVAAPITVVIAGAPVAKARPRFTRRSIAYTPAHVRKYEAHGRLAAQLAMGERPPIIVPVRAEIIVDLVPPGSWSGKRREAALRGDVRPTTRPDCDNYVKAALDAINAIVVTDDSLIVELAATKRYAAVPPLSITVTPLSALAAQGGRRQHEPHPRLHQRNDPVLRRTAGVDHPAPEENENELRQHQQGRPVPQREQGPERRQGPGL